MNNLTKIAALPTGGGCQAALRAEDTGVERNRIHRAQPWELAIADLLAKKFINESEWERAFAGRGPWPEKCRAGVKGGAA